jgi:hypothetical protein
MSFTWAMSSPRIVTTGRLMISEALINLMRHAEFGS